jgi:hypothetical protein
MDAESLRKLANYLREEAKQVEQRKTVKCAQVLDAAKALYGLRKKVTNVC